VSERGDGAGGEKSGGWILSIYIHVCVCVCVCVCMFKRVGKREGRKVVVGLCVCLCVCVCVCVYTLVDMAIIIRSISWGFIPKEARMLRVVSGRCASSFCLPVCVCVYSD
jgi:hypothetical protein